MLACEEVRVSLLKFKFTRTKTSTCTERRSRGKASGRVCAHKFNVQMVLLQASLCDMNLVAVEGWV